MKKLFYFAVLLLSSAFIANAQDQYNQYGVKVDIDPLQAEAQDGILVLRSKNNSGYKIWFDNRVQTDGAVFFGEPSWADGISNDFSIRRARFAVKAQINKDWYGEVDMDMANGVFELKDAIIRYTGLENWQFQMGSFKEIFSLQRNNSSRYLQFIERPMVCSALAPSRHLGLNANYYNKGLFLNLGIMGQEIEGEETRSFVEESSKGKGPDNGLTYTFKAVYQPGWNKTDWGMHIGAAASYRNPKTSDETFGKMRYSTRNSTSINRKKYIDLNADKALAADDQKIMGGSAMAYAVGLNYYINDHVKVQLNWQYNDNDRFASGKGNKFFCGVDENGAATRNPYYTRGKAGVDYHMVAMRFEIDF